MYEIGKCDDENGPFFEYFPYHNMATNLKLFPKLSDEILKDHSKIVEYQDENSELINIASNFEVNGEKFEIE